MRTSSLLLLILVLTAVAGAQGQQTDSEKLAPFGLSPEAVEVAKEAKVVALMHSLADERTKNGIRSLETLSIRQEIVERVLAASLDVDSVNAVVGFEIEHVRAARGGLQAKRDKAQNLINLAGIFVGGIPGVVGTAMQFSQRTANVGNGIGAGGGAASVVLSLVGLHQQGGTSDLGNSPRIISRFSGKIPAAAEEVSSVFPQDVWEYLNSAPPDKPGRTRRDQLMEKWQKEGKLDQDGLLKSEEKLKALGRLGQQPPRLTIGEMDDVQAMLLDISASVSLMKRDLGEILRSLAPKDN
ncbi:MAG: hypothetical protein JO053_07000 [Acidobacteria bacterium]|nr:hypothetical protein [Acidobacteriota bacterium]